MQNLEPIFYQVLYGNGIDILNNPNRFISSLADISNGNMEQQSAVNLALRSGILPQFYQFAQSPGMPAAGTVERASDYICKNYGMDHQWTRSFCIDMVHAIEQYTGRPRTTITTAARTAASGGYQSNSYTPAQRGQDYGNDQRYTPHQTGAAGVPSDGSGKNGTKLAVIVLGVALAGALIALLWSHLSHSNTPEPTPAPVVTVTETVTPEPTQNPTPTPTATPDQTAYAQEAVGTYIYAFINDVNRGSYDQMNRAVQSGSNMERLQREFLTKRSGDNITEQLMDSHVTSSVPVDENTFHVTTVETYEIWMDADPPHSKVTQKCTYVVKRQNDGSWKVADFVGEEQVLERTVLD